jgi:hypothetical protein
MTKAGETITLADLAVGDQIGFSQERQTEGSYNVTAIRVVLPAIGGEVTAIDGNTITVTGKDGTTGTIHVNGDTTYEVAGDQRAVHITVSSFVIAGCPDGRLARRGSGPSGMRGLRSVGRGFRGGRRSGATPAPRRGV